MSGSEGGTQKRAAMHLAGCLPYHYFGESYQSCGWERLVPFFQLSGWVTATETEVRLDFSPFNHRAMERDLQDLCRKAHASGVHLPDGRRLVLTVGQQRRRRLDGPLANTR